MKKIISLCLAIFILLGTMGMMSCTKDKDASNAGDSIVDSDGSAFSTVRRADYDKYEFRILYFSMGDGLNQQDFDATSLKGEVLNDLIFKKNSIVEEEYNIKLKLDLLPKSEQANLIRNVAASGDTPHDVYGIGYQYLSLAYEGWLLNLNTLEDLSFDSEWWDSNWIKSMGVNDQLYCAAGDFSIQTQLSVSVVCFNKNLFKTYRLEEPYDLVRSGKWTYEKLLEYTSDFYVDLNEDGVMDVDDQYGLTGWRAESAYSMFYSSGFSFGMNSKQDGLQLRYNADKLNTAFEYVYKIWNEQKSYLNHGSSSTHSYSWDVFKDDRALFCDTTLSKISLFLKDMESPYGILPLPKMNEDQENYASYTGRIIPLTCVSKAVSDPQRSGNIIEALCTVSYDRVTPDTFEIVTKLQNAHDADSGEMIDIAIRNKFFDPVHWYEISGLHEMSEVLIRENSTNIASYLRSYYDPAKKALNAINEKYSGLKNN